MPQIVLYTKIKAPPQRCFDLSRSIDLHKISTSSTNEEAVAGITSGLIGLNEYVTWRARHFGIWFKLTTKITSFSLYQYFTDEMVGGPFSYIKHLHTFEQIPDGTMMIDDFQFQSPHGFLGTLVDKLFMTKHLENLLLTRNETIKHYAETSLWKKLLL